MRKAENFFFLEGFGVQNRDPKADIRFLEVEQVCYDVYACYDFSYAV